MDQRSFYSPPIELGQSPGTFSPFQTPRSPWISDTSAAERNDSFQQQELSSAASLIEDKHSYDNEFPELGSVAMEYRVSSELGSKYHFRISEDEALELPEAILDQYNSKYHQTER